MAYKPNLDHIRDDREAARLYADRLDRLAGTVHGVLRDYRHRLRKLQIEKAVCGPLLIMGLLEDFMRSVESDVPLNLFADALTSAAPPQPEPPTTSRIL